MLDPALRAAVEPSTWNPVDLREIVSGDYTGPMPALLRRSDGKHLIYPGKLHSVAGAPGGGKSWIAQVLSSQLLMTGSVVLYIDLEDTPDSIVSRLKTLGVPDQTILDRFGYVSPSEPLPEGGVAVLDAWGDAADLVVIDGVTDAMTLHGWNPLDNKDAALFIQRLVRPFGSGTRQPAVLLVDHVTKSKDNRGNYALGAQHKLAAVQVQFTVETTTPFDQDHDGTITMSVTKDRYGQVQRLADAGDDKKVAQFHFRHPVFGGGAMTVSVDPPAGRRDSGGSGLDQTMLFEILRVVGHSENGAIKSQIKALVTGRDSVLMNCLDHLKLLGLIEGFPSGRTTAWKLARPIEGISPASSGSAVDDSAQVWLSAADVAQMLHSPDVLPNGTSVPEDV
jgi:hypothetical protein